MTMLILSGEVYYITKKYIYISYFYQLSATLS